MKWLVVAVAIVSALAAGRWARSRPRVAVVLLFLAAFVPFTNLIEDYASLNLVSHEHYRGDARGFEVTILDLIALALWMALPRPRWPMPYRRLALAYVLVAGLSVLWAWETLYAAFGVWRAVRLTFFAIVIARACELPRAPPVLLQGFAWGLIVQLAHALWQRYVEGAFQVRGTFAHQNSLAMAANLVLPVMLALVLARDLAPRQRALAAGALGAGAVCVVLTLSRGALVMLPLGLGLVYVGSLLRRPTAMKLRVGAAGLVVLLALGIKSFDSLVERFLYAPAASAESRDLFEGAAASILSDHPLGVGINNFSHVLEHGGYGEDVGLPDYDHSGIVHHVYWLTAAEMGYLGLLVYLGLVVFPIVVGVRWFRRFPDDVRGDVILGCTAGLIITALQGILEWLARQTLMSHLIWIQAVLVLALVRQLREERLGHSPPTKGK